MVSKPKSFGSASLALDRVRALIEIVDQY